MQNSFRYSARRPSKRNANINITNLMDVMMVLLVVFMVAAPLMTSGIALNLPKVGGKAFEGKETSIKKGYDENPQIAGQLPFDEFYQKALDVFVNGKLLYQAAEKAKVSETAEYENELRKRVK